MQEATNTIRVNRRSGTNVRNLAMSGMLSAVAFVLMFMDFPIPALIPPFVKMDVSDLPALLGAFALGPVYGIVITFLKNVLHIIIAGTSTACAGELSNFLIGAVFTYVAGWLYHRKKSRKGAIIGALVGAIAMAVLSVPINYYISYPAYIKFYGLPLEGIMEMYQVVWNLWQSVFHVELPALTGLTQCLIIFNAPFTLLKGLLDVALCFMVYKPLSPILHGKR